MSIKTESGFECTIDDDVLNDWEILESFRAIDKGDISAIVDVAPMFLGADQYKTLKDHIKKEHGKVKTTIMVQELSEIMQQANQTKNS